MNIIVNGGSRGIGREIVLHMAGDRDNQILVTGRNEVSLKEIVRSSKTSNISCISMDLASISGNAETIAGQIKNRFSKVDILINCAGNLVVKEFLKVTDSDARTMMEANFFGPATFTKLVVPLMGAGSHIVNISSMGGVQGSSKYRGLAYYSASKSAMACLTECLAEEFRELGIRVNCLALGSVQTEMFEKAFPGSKAVVSAPDMARFIADFALNGSKFFNGKILPVASGNP